MKKVLIIFGTRPEVIKMAPVYNELKKYPKLFKTYVCSTSQHRDMLDQVLSVFNIKIDIDLNLMKKDQDLFDITSSILKSIKTVYEKIKPEIVLVHGDTTTTFACTLGAFYFGVPVGHVEAGLRTFKIK